MYKSWIWLLIGIMLTVLPAFAAEQAGIVKVAKGVVTIERDGQKAAVAAGVPVFAGDRITTGADGSVGIALRDDTLLSAGPKSVLHLDSFIYNATTHAGAIDSSLKRGTLAVVSGKIAKQPSNTVQFRTPASIVGVRGTEFLIEVPGKED
jgi:hypothetical protein